MTLRIRHKVLLPALAVIVVLLALAGYSFYSIWQINSLAEDLKRDHLPGTVSARDMGLLLDTLVRLKKVAAVTTDPGDAAEYIEVFTRTREELDSKLESLPQEPVHRRLRLALSILYGALETLTQETADIPQVAVSVETAEKEARDRLSDLDEHYARKVQRSVETVAEIGRVAARSTLYALLAGLVVSVVVWILILLSLSRPLRELVAGTERVAQGRFGEPIPVLSQDELGTLSAAFNRMAASLSELDRLRDDFVATASHELKTPLTCIKGLASLLRSGSRGPLTEEQRATLVQVEEEVDQVTSFVSQLLDLSRLRAGRVTMNIRSLPAEAFFGSVARGFEGVAERKGIRYEVRISRDLSARIQVDPDRLREVMYNLLGNAFKFTETGGQVRFEAEGDSEWVRVTVSDTGPGIQQEDLPFVFERYYRGAGSYSSRENEGAGLGLAIARGIVEKHGGRIWVEANSGRGSRFVFRIPAAGAGQTDEGRFDPQKVGAKEI